MSQNIKPNFFIVGAPKCGTTALNDYLKAHPDIYIPPFQKEIHFFGADLHFLPGRTTDLETYLSFFSGWKGQKCIGEASVWYLFSTCAAQEIAKFSPDARIIIMLRNPVDMLYSLYFHALFENVEDQPSFQAALEAEEDRKQGKRIPKNTPNVQALFYTELPQFTEQVRRYFDAFGRDRVHIIIYDDFKSDAAKVYKETLEFLEVDPYFQPEFKVINPSKDAKNRLVQRFLNAPPSPVLTAAKALIRQPLRRYLSTTIRQWNIRHVARDPMPPEMRSRLQHKFLPEVEQLSILLGRDLTDWCYS